MENNSITTVEETDTKKANNFGWKISVIFLTIALIVACGALVVVVLKNNNEKVDLQDTITSLQNTQLKECFEDTVAKITDEPADALPTEPEVSGNNVRRYLAITEWGIKIEIPSGLENDASYYIDAYGDDDAAELVAITSKISVRVLDSDDYTVQAYIIRTQNKSFQPTGYKQIGKIGNYYYFVDDVDLVTLTHTVLVNAARTITAI